MTDKGIHSICTDHFDQSVIATEHLLEHGHQRIGLLVIQKDEWGAKQRIEGYTQTLKKAGITIEPTLIAATSEQPVYDTLNRWQRQGVTALLNFSEDCSLEVLHILSNVLNLKIGEDISTISLEDLPIYQYLSPPQTTIRQPLEQLAKLAVEQMLGLCEKSAEQTVDITLSSELIPRDSVMRLD